MEKKSKKLNFSKESLRQLGVLEVTGGTGLTFHCTPYPSYSECLILCDSQRKCY